MSDAGLATHATGPARRLVLASASPRRRELLERAGYDFVVHEPHIDERTLEGEGAEECVRRLARRKARAAADARASQRDGAGAPDVRRSAIQDGVLGRTPSGAELVLAADTVVVLEARTLGKPRDPEEAVGMLLALSGRTHRVLTGVCLLAGAVERWLVEESRVVMHEIDPEEARAYARSGEPLDKAGSYALQGAGARFVQAVDGSRSNVIGLPLEAIEPHLRALGVRPR